VLRVEYRPLESLIPYARNARTHPEAQVAQIAASIKSLAARARLVAVRKTGHWAGDRKQTTVWGIRSLKRDTERKSRSNA